MTSPAADGVVRSLAAVAEPGVAPDRIDPRQLPELRAALVTALSTGFAIETWRMSADRGSLQTVSGERASAEEADDLRRNERSRLRRATLFAVSPDMTGLIVGASRSPPGYRLHPDDVPAPVGFCMYGQPVGVTDGLEPIVAASWELMEEGVAIGWYSRIRPPSMEVIRRELGSSADLVLPIAGQLRGEGRRPALRRGRRGHPGGLPRPGRPLLRSDDRPGDGRGRAHARARHDLARHG